jgi:hypothetical protein
MKNVTEEQIEAGVKAYRGRCLDHGTEWRTAEPAMCDLCHDEYTLVAASSPGVETAQNVTVGSVPTERSEAVTPAEPIVIAGQSTEPEAAAPTEVRRPRGRPPKNPQ